MVYAVKVFLAGCKSRDWILYETIFGKSAHLPEISGGAELTNKIFGVRDENISCGQYDLSGLRCADYIRGGGSKVNDTLSCRECNGVKEKQNRGGL